MALGKAHRVPVQLCLRCGHRLDAASAIKGRGKPRPGDITLCIKCGHTMLFDDALKLREPTAAEAAELAQNPHLARGKLAIALGRAKVPKWREPDDDGGHA